MMPDNAAIKRQNEIQSNCEAIAASGRSAINKAPLITANCIAAAASSGLLIGSTTFIIGGSRKWQQR